MNHKKEFDLDPLIKIFGSLEKVLEYLSTDHNYFGEIKK
jgi:hypothetical protein